MNDDQARNGPKRLVSLATIFYTALLVILVVGANVLPRLIAWLDEIHPRNVTLWLAQVEDAYGEVSNLDEVRSRIDTMEYMRDHYRYEDMPEYQGNKAVEALAVQRAKTLKSLANSLRAFSGEDHGDDPEAWQAWLKSAQQAQE